LLSDLPVRVSQENYQDFMPRDVRVVMDEREVRSGVLLKFIAIPDRDFRHETASRVKANSGIQISFVTNL